MAYKFQLDDAIMSGTLVQEGATEVVGNLTATSVISGSSLTLGSAAFSVSAAGAIAGATSIDGSGDLTMGTITMSGFTVDADGDTVGKTLSASAGVSAGAASTFFGGCDLQLGGITNAGAIAGATSIDGSGDLTMGTITMTGFTVDADGDSTIKTLSSSATITANALTVNYDALFSADVALSGASDTALAVAADSLYFLDVTTGKVRRDTVSDIASSMAGVGLGAASGQFALDLNELGAASVSVANDSIAIIDADDSSATKKESIADLVTAMAGGGLTATNGVLSTDAGSVAVGADGGTLAEGYNYFTGTVNASCTLPASPSVGDVVTVKAGNTTTGQNITINCAGSHLIDGDATNIHLESPYAAVTLVYVVANDWRLV